MAECALSYRHNAISIYFIEKILRSSASHATLVLLTDHLLVFEINPSIQLHIRDIHVYYDRNLAFNSHHMPTWWTTLCFLFAQRSNMSLDTNFRTDKVVFLEQV